MLALASIALFVYYLVAGDPNKRIPSCLFSLALAILPYVLQLLFRRKFSNVMLLLYFAYVILSAYVGSAVGVYKMNTWYDKIMHFLSGYIACYVGLIIATRTVSKKAHPWFVLLVCIMFSFSCACVWEIIEYSCDTLLGTTMQGPHIVDGVPLVTDTMLDMLVAFVGILLYTLQYIIHIRTHKNLLIDYTIHDWELHTPISFSLNQKDSD